MDECPASEDTGSGVLEDASGRDIVDVGSVTSGVLPVCVIPVRRCNDDSGGSASTNMDRTSST